MFQRICVLESNDARAVGLFFVCGMFQRVCVLESMMRALLACKAAVDSVTLPAVVVHTTVVFSLLHASKKRCMCSGPASPVWLFGEFCERLNKGKRQCNGLWACTVGRGT